MSKLLLKTSPLSSGLYIADLFKPLVNKGLNPTCGKYRFITMAEQRFYDTSRPLSLDSPIIQSLADHIFDNNVCKYLFNEFMNRGVLYASEGKKPNGEFSLFRKSFKTDRFRRKVISANTHFTFTVNFTEKINITVKNKVHTKKITKEMFPVLIIDIDHFNGDYSIFEKYNLTPNYLIRNPKKPQSLQVGYVLHTPAFKKKNEGFYDNKKYNRYNEPLPLDEQPNEIQFIETFSILNILFNGDTNFKLHNAKNPFFATPVGDVAWTEEPFYDISFLLKNAILAISNKEEPFSAILNENEKPFNNIDFTDITNHILTRTEANKNYHFDKNSRNCSLFDKMRHIAYELSAEYVEINAPKEFYAYLFNIAESENQSFQLPINEVKAMIRSIVKFCFKKKVSCKYPSHHQRKKEKMAKVKDYMKDVYGVNHRYSKENKELLAKKFAISVRTIEVYASQIRKEHSSKSDEKEQRINQIKALREINTKWAKISEMLGEKESTLKSMFKRYIESNKGNQTV